MLTILVINSRENLFLSIDNYLYAYGNQKFINILIAGNDLFITRDHRFN